MTTVGRFLGCVLILPPVINGVSVAEEAAWSVPTSAQQTIVKRHTLKELRDQYVVKQQLDYSCGAAALATLMVYYYGENTSEKEILELLNTRLETMTEEERARKTRIGFSLLDLKVVAQQKGYQAAGFKLTVGPTSTVAGSCDRSCPAIRLLSFCRAPGSGWGSCLFGRSGTWQSAHEHRAFFG